MPETIGAALFTLLIPGSTTAAIGTTLTIGGLTVSAATVGNLVLSAASIGASLALSSQRPKLKPQEVQQSLRQAIGPRIKHYGTVAASGTFAFWEARNSVFHQVIVTGHGVCDEVIEHRFGGTTISVDPSSGALLTEPWGSQVVLRYSNGDAPSNFVGLQGAFPGVWTTDHKLLGVSSTYLQLIDPGAKSFARVFQGGIPNYRLVGKFQRVLDPRTNLRVWSDNSALVILDFLTHPDGFNIPIAKMDLASWAAFADLCDEPVPLLAGGTERRYRISGSYALNERRVDVLRRMFDTCDGRLKMTREGKFGVTGGRYIAPDVTVYNDAVIEDDVSFYASPNERFTQIVPTFTSALHDYQTVDAAPWVDAEAEARSGRLSTTLDLVMVPSHTQAQRLTKIAGGRAKARYRSTVTTNMRAFNAWQEATIRRVDPELDVDLVCEVKAQAMEWAAGRVRQTMSISEVHPSFWEWNPSVDEGPAPLVPPPTSVLDTIETPQNVVPIVEPVIIDAVTNGARLKVTWDAPATPGRGADIEYTREISPGVYDLAQFGNTEADRLGWVSSTINNDGSKYEIRVRFTSTGGASGPFSPAQIVTANADNVQPAAATITSATGGAGQITATYTLPNSANCVGARIWRNTSATLTGATLFSTVFGSPSQTLTTVVTGYSAGTRFVIVEAINGSNLGGPIAAQSATVT